MDEVDPSATPAVKIPHSQELRSDFERLVSDLAEHLKSQTASAPKNSDLFGIFKISTATHASFRAFSEDTQALMLAAAGLARRVSVLAVLGQLVLARVELRRLIECTLWYLYFLDHAIEWAEFQRSPGQGWESRGEKAPIASAAHAPIGFFSAYAVELLERDPSKLGLEAARIAQVAYGNLSAFVHAATGAVGPGGILASAFDPVDAPSMGSLREELQRVSRACVLMCAAANVGLLNRLDGIDRAWFDWLVGNGESKTIRGAAFGVPR